MELRNMTLRRVPADPRPLGSVESARRAMAFEGRLVNRARRDGASYDFDTDTPFLQQAIDLGLGFSSGRHDNEFRADAADARRLIHVGDFRAPPVDAFHRV